MAKYLIGHIFTNNNTKGETLFEHVNKDGQIRYYTCRMKITDGKYLVKIKHNQVVSCWRQKNTFLSKLEIQKAFRDFERLTKDWRWDLL